VGESQSEKSKTERERESHGLALLAGAHTGIRLDREDLCTLLLLCPGKKLGKETKMLFPYYGIFSAI
jgi:hypothetical protein